MDVNKVLVFDDFRYFSKFLKYEFKGIKFVNGDKRSIFYGDDIDKELSLVVFALYSEDDLINVLRLYSSGVQLLVCNHSPKFVNKISDIKNLDVLDCMDTKRGLKKDLHNYFEGTFNLIN